MFSKGDNSIAFFRLSVFIRIGAQDEDEFLGTAIVEAKK